MKRWTKIALAALILLAATTAVWSAVTLTTKISLGFATQYTSSGDLSTATDVMNISRSVDLTSGTGANQANVLFTDSRGLVDNADNDANEVLDIYASGTLKDSLGTLLTIEKLKAIYVYNTCTTQSLLMGGGTTPVGFCADASDIITIPPGGKIMMSAPNATGWAVTTNKNIKFQQAGALTGTLTYEIILIGVD